MKKVRFNDKVEIRYVTDKNYKNPSNNRLDNTRNNIPYIKYLILFLSIAAIIIVFKD